MGRAPCCEKVGLNRGPWTKNEDEVLINYINENGHGNWRALPKKAGLLRCGKSCRLRWANYLRPDIKRGNFTKEEEDVIIQLNQELGNKWSVIASKLPGRTDNEIKNVWNTHLRKRLNNPPQETKRQRTRKRSRKDSKSKKDDTNEQPVKNISAIKDNNNSNGDSDRQECIKMKETKSPSQSLLKTSTSVNSFASTVTSSSCTSCIEDDTLGNSNEVDNFWADVLSGNLSIMETSDHLPQVHGYGTKAAQDFPLLSTSSAVDGFGYFDQNKNQDNEMDFWCNYLTIDGELQELMSNM